MGKCIEEEEEMHQELRCCEEKGGVEGSEEKIERLADFVHANEARKQRAGEIEYQ